MKMRWLAAGIAAVLITGGAATLAQRVITQKTRGVLPEKNDSAHADSRQTKEIVFAVQTSKVEPNQPAILPTPPLAVSPPAPTAIDLPAESNLAMPAGLAEGLVVETAAATEPVSAPLDIAETPEAVDPPASIMADSRPTDPAVNPVAAAAPVEDTPAQADPVQSVENFVERNRKEAENAIQNLTTEAENLKDRLTRVEKALVRWQAFSRALNTDQPPSQTDVVSQPKAKWERSTPEPAREPARDSGVLPPPPATESVLPPVEPTPAEPEVPANPTLPTPGQPTAPPPDEPKPTESPDPGLPSPVPDPGPGPLPDPRPEH